MAVYETDKRVSDGINLIEQTVIKVINGISVSTDFPEFKKKSSYN